MSKKRKKSRRSRKANSRKGKRPRSFQPKAGSLVLHCGHLETADDTKFHWWHLGDPRPFKRPDGSEGESEWITACEPCFLRAKGQAALVEVRDDGIWLAGEDLTMAMPYGDVKQQIPLGGNPLN